MTGTTGGSQNHRHTDEFPAGVSFGRARGNDMMPSQMIPVTPGEAPPATFDASLVAAFGCPEVLP